MTDEIKRFAIEQRKNGRSLQQVVDDIAESYGVLTSRQNIFKVLKRAKAKEEKQSKLVNIDNEILQIVARFRFIKDCENNEVFFSIKPYHFRSLIRDHRDEIEDIKINLAHEVQQLVISGMSKDEILEALSYEVK